MKTKTVLGEVMADVHAAADPAFRESVRQHFSMNVDHFLGARNAAIRKIAAKHFSALKPLPMHERLDWCDALLAARWFECKIIAFDWAHRSRRLYEPKHLRHFHGWLSKHVDDWNDCDDLSTHVLGEFFLKFPERAGETSRWARSKQRWVQRGAAVSLILPVRNGQQLGQAFAVADALLKEASRQFQPQVFAFVMQRKEAMPRTALRYAIEKMPPALKQQAMA